MRIEIFRTGHRSFPFAAHSAFTHPTLESAMHEIAIAVPGIEAPKCLILKSSSFGGETKKVKVFLGRSKLMDPFESRRRF